MFVILDFEGVISMSPKSYSPLTIEESTGIFWDSGGISSVWSSSVVWT